MTYNLAEPTNTGRPPILKALGDQAKAGFSGPIDILLLQEQNRSMAATDAILAELNAIYEGGTYVRGTFTNFSGTDPDVQTVIYRTNTVTLKQESEATPVGTNAGSRTSMRYQFGIVGYDGSADFYIYNNHLKASDTDVDAARRAAQVQQIRTNADALGEGAHIIYAGDMNIYDASDQAFIAFTNAGAGQAFDPVNRVGEWNTNPSFLDVHTQSPVTTNDQFYTNQVGGGMDNRFDFQLVTSEVLDGRGFAYITNSYWAFGNTATHTYNGALSSGSVSALQALLPGYTTNQVTNLIGALMSNSDHLPVVADYQLPARMGVATASFASRAIVGAVLTNSFWVSNNARVRVTNGADRLEYSFSGSGNLTAAGGGTNWAMTAADAHTFTFAATNVGTNTGSLRVTASSPQTANANATNNFSVNVLHHAAPSFASNSAITNLAIDFGTLNFGASAATNAFSLHSLAGALGAAWTARLDLLSVVESSDPDGMFATALSPFANLEAGSSISSSVVFDPIRLGVFTGAYQLAFADENIPGSTSLGSLSLQVTGNVSGAFDVATGQTRTVSSVVSGNGGVTKTGSGTLVFSANNTYAGATTVSAGRFVANGTNTLSSVTVSAGATLAGTGKIGALTASGTLAPGGSVGTLSAGATVLNGGGSFDLEVYDWNNTAGTGWDLLSVTGNLTLSNTAASPFTINLISLLDSSTPGSSVDWNQNVSWTNRFISYTGSLLGESFTPSLFHVNTDGFQNAINGSFSVINVSGGLALLYSTAFNAGARFVWNAGSGLWSAGANWTNGTLPGNDSTIVFSGAGGSSTNNAVPGISGLVFSNTSGVYVVSGDTLLSGSGGVLNVSTNTHTVGVDLRLGAAQTFDAVSNSLTFSGAIDNNANTLTVNGAANTFLNGVISNTGGLSKLGAGTLMLGGNNIFTGALAAEGGTVLVNGTQATATINVAGGATLRLGAGDLLADGATLSLGNGVVEFGGFNDTVSAFNQSGGVFTNGMLSASTFGLSGGTIGGTLAGATANVTGAVSLPGVINAAVNVNSGGTLTLAANDRIGSSNAVTVNAGTLAMAANNNTIASFILTNNGSLTGTGTLTAATYTLNGGTIGANLGVGAATSSSGTTTLSGTVLGNLAVNGGTLNLGASDRLGDASSLSISSGAFGMSNFTETVGTFAIAGGTLGGTSGKLTAATYALDGGIIAAKLGAGTVTSSSGTTALNATVDAATVNIAGGIVELGAGDLLDNAAAVNISGGALGLSNFTDTVGTFTITGGTLAGSGTLTASSYALNGGTIAANLGAGTVTASAGTTTVNGALSGNLSVSGGTVNLGAANRIADSAAVTVSSGTLNFGGNDTVGAVQITGGAIGGSGALTGSGYDVQGGTISVALAGSGALTKSGAGTATLGGNNSNFAGAINVQSGVLVAAHNNALGGNAITLTNGGIQAAQGVTIGNNFTIGTAQSAQVYSQDFNSIGAGLPTGWTVRTAASSNVLGTLASLASSPTAWGDATGGFKNFAAATGLDSAASIAVQSNAVNRALGVRQVGSGGYDPGASFNYAFTTAGVNVNSISFDLMMLSVQNRSTTWSIQYGVGTNPSSFTTLGTWADPGVFGTTSLTFTTNSFGSALNNRADLTFRLVALSGSTGSSNRDSIAIDNFVIDAITTASGSGILGISEAGSATFTGAITNNNAATLTAADGGIAMFSGAISGAGSVNKTGAGTVVLAANNTYSGATTVSTGRLVANGTNTASAVTVGSGASLGGSGQVGSLTVAGMVAPGNSIGTLGAGNTVFSGGGSFELEMWDWTNAPGTGWDLLSVGGDLTLSNTTGNKFTINLVSMSSGSTPGLSTNFNPGLNFTNTFVTYSGSLGGTAFSSDLFTVNAGSFSNAFNGVFSITNISGGLALLYTASLPSNEFGWNVASGSWSDASRWTNLSAPSTTGSKIVFSGAGGSTTNDAVSSIAGLFFNNGAGSYTISGGSFTNGAGGVTNSSGNAQTVNNDITLGAAQTFHAAAGNLSFGGSIDTAGFGLTVDGASNTVFGGSVSGSGGLSKSGAGTLLLSGANDYSGGTLVSGGVLSGDTRSLQGSVTNNTTVVFDQTTNGTYAGAMSGAGVLVKSGSGTVILAGANTYSGGTLVGGGTLQGDTTSLQGALTNNAAVVFDQVTNGTYAGAMSGSGSLFKIGSGTVILSGANSYSGGTTVVAGGLSGDTTSLRGDIANSGTVVFNQTTNCIYAGTLSGAGALTKSGNATLTLTGSNSYNGGTVISAGALQGDTASLQGAISNGATLMVSQATNGTYAGTLSGAGALAKSGAGTVTLGGNNSNFSGTINLQAGALVAAHNNAFGVGAITVTNGSIRAANGVTIANNFTIGTEGGLQAFYSQNFNTMGTSSSAFLPTGWKMSAAGQGTTNTFWTNTGNLTAVTQAASSGSPTAGGAYNWGFSNDANNRSIGFLSSGGYAEPNSIMFAFTNTTGQTLTNFMVSFDYLRFRTNSTAISNVFYVSTSSSSWGAGISTNIWNTNVSGYNFAPVSLSLSNTVTLTISNGAVGYMMWTFDPTTAANSQGLGLDNFVISTQAAASGSGILGISEAGSATFSGAITNLSAATLLAGDGGAVTFSGPISGGGSLTKSGAGTVILGAANTLSGGFLVESGVLRVQHAGAFGSGFVTQASGLSTIVFDAPGTVANAMSIHNVRAMQDVTLSGAKILNNATYNVDPNVTLTEAGQLSDSGGITKQGVGTLVLTASSNFTGPTAVNEGTLRLDSATGSSLGSTPSVSIASGATLLLSQSDQVNNSAAMSLSGGTIRRASGVSEVFGNLNVITASVLDFSGGTGGVLEFSGLDIEYTPSAFKALQLLNFTQGNTLVIRNTQNWTSEINAGFTFGGAGGFGSSSFSEGTFTITAIPEPSTYLAAAGLLSLMLWPSRKRLLKDAKKIFAMTPPMRDRLAAKRA